MNLMNRRGILAFSCAVTATAVAGRRAQAQTATSGSGRPAEPPPPLEAYARTPLVDEIAISPDGKRIAAISQKGDDKFLLYFDLPNGAPQHVNLGTVKLRDLFWGSNDNIIVTNAFTSDRYAYDMEKHDYWLASSIDTKTQKIQQFFSQETYPAVAGALSRVEKDGKYTVTVARYEHGVLNLYAMSPDGKTQHIIITGSTRVNDWILSPEGEPVAYSTYDDFYKIWHLYYRTGPSTAPGDFKMIYEADRHASAHPSLSGMAADGKSIVLRFHDDKSDDVYRTLSLDGTLSAPLFTEASGKRPFPLYHPTTRRLSGFGYYEETLIHTYTDPLLAKLYESIPKVIGDGYRSHPVDFAEDPRKMLIYSESSDDPGGYYFVDFSTGAAGEVSANYPDLPAKWVTQKQPIEYKAADGLTIHGYLTLPPLREAKALPLVVLPHGGPQERDYIDFDWQTQTLASLGYAVLQPNFRGSAGYGESFVLAGHGEWGRKMQTDLSDGVRYLVGRGTVDPKRVAIFGSSYGGYAALAGATLDPGIYTCAVSVAGPSDLKSMVDREDENTGYIKSDRVLFWREFMGDPAKWNDVSPARQAAKAYCPILLIHGTDDTVVSIDQSQRMEQALKAANKSVEFITYKGQDHWETIESTRIAMMKATVDFIQKYNPA